MGLFSRNQRPESKPVLDSLARARYENEHRQGVVLFLDRKRAKGVLEERHSKRRHPFDETCIEAGNGEIFTQGVLVEFGIELCPISQKAYVNRVKKIGLVDEATLNDMLTPAITDNWFFKSSAACVAGAALCVLIPGIVIYAMGSALFSKNPSRLKS